MSVNVTVMVPGVVMSKDCTPACSPWTKVALSYSTVLAWAAVNDVAQALETNSEAAKNFLTFMMLPLDSLPDSFRI
jgi:hypothetical protein